MNRPCSDPLEHRSLSGRDSIGRGNVQAQGIVVNLGRGYAYVRVVSRTICLTRSLLIKCARDVLSGKANPIASSNRGRLRVHPHILQCLSIRVPPEAETCLVHMATTNHPTVLLR